MKVCEVVINKELLEQALGFSFKYNIINVQIQLLKQKYS